MGTDGRGVGCGVRGGGGGVARLPALTQARQVVGSMSTSILRTGTMKRMRDCGSTPAMAKTW